VKILKDHFSRGVQLLADNELHPALPAQAFAVVQPQTAQFVAGNLQSPGYRTSRALDLALLPAGDPVLREVTPPTVTSVTLNDVKQGLVIGKQSAPSPRPFCLSSPRISLRL
jgi:zinc protease